MSARLLEVREASCGYRGKAVVHLISLSVYRGQVLCLLGPNGSGKTTFFKTVLGLLPPLSGRIILGGRDLGEYSLNELARSIAYVPQNHSQDFAFSVLDVVTMGRCAHIGILTTPRKHDYEKAEECLERLGVAALTSSRYAELSGGERQLVLIARALAQDTELLVMDEPTSNLDFGNQIRLLTVIKGLAASGIGIIMTTHFPDHSFLAGDSVAVMKSGRMEAFGPPDEILTEVLLRSVYGVDVLVIETKNESGVALKTCVPLLDKRR